MDEIPEAKDLFGEPLRPAPSKRGRRRLRFPAEVYENVEVLAAAGNLSQEEIADAIGVSEPTLRKYFRKELDHARSRQRAEALECLARGMRKGNVSAAKAYLAELDRQGAAIALNQRRHAPPPQGKKAAAKADADAAVAAGGKFATRATPRLATVGGAAVEVEEAE